jgi:hypothetical protein
MAKLYSLNEILKQNEWNTRAAWKIVRKELRKANPSDSDRLFNAVIKRMQWFYSETGQIDDIHAFYNHEAGSKVNNSRSSFYLYGI